MEFFKHQITFFSNVPGETGLELKEIPKTATFKELDQRDKLQHKLHFKILGMMEGIQTTDADTGDAGKMKIDSDALYDITVKFVATMHVPDNDFTLPDQKEFLSDSGALLRFGLWLLGEKIMPFFLKLRPSST